MRKSTTEFSEALAAALREAGVSLSSLQGRLAKRGEWVSIGALSHWRSGVRKPQGAKSLSMVSVIEEILGLAAGELTSLIPDGTKPEPSRHPGRPPILSEHFETVYARTVANVGEVGLQEQSAHLVADVDAQGLIERLRVRMRVQAVDGPATEFSWSHHTEAPTDVMPVFTALQGCRFIAAETGSWGVGSIGRFAIDHTVPEGETTVFEFEVRFPSGYPRRNQCGHISLRSMQEVLLWVRFPAAALPSWIEEVVVTSDGIEKYQKKYLDGSQVEATRSNEGPGLLMIRWGSALSGCDPDRAARISPWVLS
ncbi:hypothetical protein [Arthrobacter sp. NPDC090010]|uniref:hypothetical protein n=1 Tax=Arthrobacter sp. NPDC090010 TaxID=3363942 RepID=UPI003811B1C1